MDFIHRSSKNWLIV